MIANSWQAVAGLVLSGIISVVIARGSSKMEARKAELTAQAERRKVELVERTQSATVAADLKRDSSDLALRIAEGLEKRTKDAEKKADDADAKADRAQTEAGQARRDAANAMWWVGRFRDWQKQVTDWEQRHRKRDQEVDAELLKLDPRANIHPTEPFPAFARYVDERAHMLPPLPEGI